MKKILRNSKGITLVALVVTIVILLILAGLTIAQLSNSGLFEKSKIARDKYKNAQDDEETQISKYTNEIDRYVSGNRDYTPISYSTEEQYTGMKWIDGKPIYQKTIEPNLSIGPNDTSIDLTPYISNIDMIFIDETHSWASQANGDFLPITFAPVSLISQYGITYKTVGRNKLTFYGGTAAGTSTYTIKYLTIQYTKTTD